MEELDFKALLDQFNSKGFQKGEQVILANFGTNQTLMSIIFGEPNTMKLIEQKEKDGEIDRTSELHCGDTLVCNAHTGIPKDRNTAYVINDICAGELGLGQIVVKYNLANRRTLVHIGRNSRAFWRYYTIEGPKIYLKILEFFPREPFEAVGWIRKFTYGDPV